MFEFVVKYLGFLKHIPLAAHTMDAWMMIWTHIFSPEILTVIERIEAEVLTWDGVSCAPHKFGGLQFNLHTREIGHIHHNGIIDILFDLKTKHQFIAEDSVKNHHSFKASGWISFYIQSTKDYSRAIQLLRISYTRAKEATRRLQAR